ncbi:MAG: ABC transporter permease [Chthoniobacterales bacterium]
MRRFFILFNREMAFYFHSPLAYVVLFFFLLITGFNFYAGVLLLNQAAGTEVTMVQAFFNTGFFWSSFILVFPLITMRLFSEEYKMGTIEPLMTAPVHDLQVILAKFASALMFYIILWLPSLLYFIVFEWQSSHQAADAAGAYIGSYTMLLLMGMFYVSIGCLASSLTKNQIVAAIISIVAIMLMFFMGFLTFIIQSYSATLQDLTAYLSPIRHMMDYSQGIFDSRPVVFYLSMTFFMLFLTFHAFQRRRWTS